MLSLPEKYKAPIMNLKRAIGKKALDELHYEAQNTKTLYHKQDNGYEPTLFQKICYRYNKACMEEFFMNPTLCIAFKHLSPIIADEGHNICEKR